MKNLVVLIATTMILSGCAGKVTYTPPSGSKKVTNTVTVDLPRNEVWNRVILSLGSPFFVINNLDKDSGFINVSYSGSPEKYIDCGHIESYVKNTRGERTFSFPAATAYKEFDTFENGTTYRRHIRKMNLDGRINIIVQDVGNESTLISVNIKYVVTGNETVSDLQGKSQSYSQTMSFNTNSSASFPGGNTCYATGVLEIEVLDALNL